MPILSFIFFIIDIVKSFLSKLKRDATSAYAAQSAFFVILSAFPFCMLLLTLLQYIPLQEINFIQIASKILPETIAPFVTDILTEVYESSSFALTSVTALVTLWSGSKGFLALINGMNSVYSIPETRNYFYLRFLSIIYTLVFAIMLIISLFLLVFGNSIGFWLTQTFPPLKRWVLLVISIRVIVILGILLFFFLAIFLIVPNRRSHVLLELPGALVTSIGWVGFSFLYSFYIDHMGNFSRTYGSLTAIVLSMIWIYVCMYLMFIGAEINSYLFRFVLKKKFMKLKHFPPSFDAKHVNHIFKKKDRS